MKIYEQIDNELLKGFAVARDVPDKEALLHWKGPKIEPRLWGQIVAFMHASYRKTSAEAMGRLFVRTAGEAPGWEFEVLPQTCSGAQAYEDRGHEVDFIAPLLQEGYEPFGTVHHHCNMSPGPSSTDTDDESASPGLHLTLGHLKSDVPSLDMRFTFRGVKYIVDPFEWFVPPDDVLALVVKRDAVLSVMQETECPVDMIQAADEAWSDLIEERFSQFLCAPEPCDFPQVWLSRVNNSKGGNPGGRLGLETVRFDEVPSYGVIAELEQDIWQDEQQELQDVLELLHQEVYPKRADATVGARVTDTRTLVALAAGMVRLFAPDVVESAANKLASSLDEHTLSSYADMLDLFPEPMEKEEA